ncbi:Glucose-methanol-choline oxidoreductase [Cynara cardunculus var. scolymus]|uniref:Glucose-methanol-choline oxidoreductase n=1 Tax=Cynara cardunculus var. scolymus TaxID=59895 RepID=A0A118JTW9_CYNCS|nr:Glucose-methanol-choline oxidoreductase [Cynara cardunculus var. scolymus]
MLSRSWSITAVALVTIVFLLDFGVAELPPNYTFMHEATEAPRVSFYDYIVIGGGTTGIPLAATLSANASVLLLERGGSPYGNPSITNVANFGTYFFDTSSSSPSQQFITEGVVNARSRILGGGTSINAGFYSRGEEQFNIEARLTDETLIEDSYQWIEKVMVFEPFLGGWQTALRAALVEVGVTPDNGYSYDHVIAGGTTPLAYGVAFEDSFGNMHKAFLKGGENDEIIVSAGALGSPQILILSGIGPKEQLDGQNIKSVLQQPLVGKNMSDNPRNGIFIPSPIAVEQSIVQVVGITEFGSYIEESGGINLKINGPISTGELKIENRNPFDNPSVTFNYFKEPEDLQKCVKGLETILAVIETEAFSNYTYANMTAQEILDLNMKLPYNQIVHANTSSSLEEYCKATVGTMWHYHGGCQIGQVVDDEYKVIGVDGLRVLDASTLLNCPGTNPQASLMMLGRYMGVKMLAQRLAVTKSYADI